ncbi:MAG: BTAD domain-containing putative transcriptional regulator [Beijerinckiaceae bacterium]
MRIPANQNSRSTADDDGDVAIGLIGGFSARCQGREIALRNRKTQALLACLALQEACSALRERLVGLIWSEVDEDKARGSLRQALHSLREGLAAAGCDIVDADKTTVRLRPGAVSVDILEAIAMAERGEAHPALLQHDDPVENLLASFESVDPAFQSWIISKRKALESQLAQRLEAGLASDDLSGPRREKLARALVNVDPTNEIGVRNLMAARLEIGDAAGAMHAYKVLWQLLDDEFDTEPSQPTQELFARIKTMGLDAPAASIAAAPDPQTSPRPEPRPIISVSPVDVGGIRPEHHYLLHGFRRDLLSCLVRFREWLVRDGAFEGAAPAGDEYVVDTAAHGGEAGIQLILMLREKRSGIYLWTERVRLAAETWFETQQVIVRRLAAVLNVHVSNRRLHAIDFSDEADVLAYDVWLRAQSEMTTWERAGWDRSETLLRDLIRKHPRFAPAYSNLSQLLNSVQFIKLGTWRSAAICEESIALATEATRLDPVDSRGHLALGWAYAMAGRHDRAAVHHDMACELNENDAWTLLSAGVGAACRDEHDHARILCERAMELCVSPTTPHLFYVAVISYLRGDYESVVRVSDTVWSGVRYARGWRVAALGNLGRTDDAALEMQIYIAQLNSAWLEREAPSVDSVADWFLHIMPLSHEGWTRLHDGLSRAGARLAHAEFDPSGIPPAARSLAGADRVIADS